MSGVLKGRRWVLRKSRVMTTSRIGSRLAWANGGVLALKDASGGLQGQECRLWNRLFSISLSHFRFLLNERLAL